MIGRMRARLADASDRGAAAVEAAFMISLVLVPLVIGAIEFGFAFDDWLTVSSSSREGARAAAAAGDESSADCVILEASSGALQGIDDDRVQAIWIYKQTNGGGVGNKQVYRPALPTDAPASLRCGTWFPVETNYEPASRDNTGTTRDWVGVRVVFDHDWKTGILWFSGSVQWQDDTVMRLEPDPNP